MEITSASPDDAGTLVLLEIACFADPWAPSTLDAALEDAKYVVLLARDGEAAVGYVLGWSVGAEAELARVGVLPFWRGQKVGEQLTQAFLNELGARGAREVFLEVRESNAAARAMYRKCGFKNLSTRPNYYTDGEDAVVMRMHLAPSN